MYLPATPLGREVKISIDRHEAYISIRCSIGQVMVTDSQVYGTGREILARSIVDAFLNGDFDGTVP